MLRDLQQRNAEQSITGQNFEKKINPKNHNDILIRLWPLPLIFLSLAYIWFSNPHYQITKQTVNHNTPSVMSDYNPPGKTASTAGEPGVATKKPEVPQTTTTKTKEAAPYPARNNANTKKSSKTRIIVKKPDHQAIEEKKVKSDSKPTASPNKNSSAHDQAVALYKEARDSASLIMAKKILKEALQIDPMYQPARALLLQTMLKSHAKETELGEFIEKSLELYPGSPMFIKASAHLLIQQKNFAAAATLLERFTRENMEDSQYLSLLAASYQQLNNYGQSNRIYEMLTRLQPEKAENWLGLAIAKENLNETGAAIQSYRRALDKKTLNNDVVDYIKQRLNALQ